MERQKTWNSTVFKGKSKIRGLMLSFKKIESPEIESLKYSQLSLTKQQWKYSEAKIVFR